MTDPGQLLLAGRLNRLALLEQEADPARHAELRTRPRMFVSLRLVLYDFGPEELTPPYWVAMGGLAITVLAGARIVEMADAPMVEATRGLIAGLAVVFWAFAAWLFPVLVAAGWWRHVSRRVPLSYEATLWSIVFPLGMYAVAGIYLGQADQRVLVFGAMVVHVIRTVFVGSPTPS